MTTYTFALVLEGQETVLDDETLQRLYEAGCNDASFGQRQGRIYADFAREATSFRAAVLTAIGEVESVPNLRVVHVEDEDLVGIPDIAGRVGRTRQNVWQLSKGQRGAGDFPAPVARLGDERLLWRWTEVADWFTRRSESPSSADEAKELLTMANAFLEARERIRAAVGPSPQGIVASVSAEPVLISVDSSSGPTHTVTDPTHRAYEVAAGVALSRAA